jgi:hypothetical protein
MRINVLLWVFQGVLALLFLFAGGMKLILPKGANAPRLGAMFNAAPEA